MTPQLLEWREEGGRIWKSERDGFVYSLVHLTSDAPGCEDYTEWMAMVHVPHETAQMTFDDICDEVEAAKDICQSHANAVSAAIAGAVSEEQKLADHLAALIVKTKRFTSTALWVRCQAALKAHAEARK